MSRRVIIILTLVSGVLSLVYILASYYGYDRYMTMRVKQPTRYIETYKELPKAAKDRVVISISPSPNKVGSIRPMVNSILDQTVRVDQILLPCKYRDRDSLPGYIKDVATICPVSKDYGDGIRFIPVLLKEKDSRTMIIVLKDNVVYGKDYIETLVSTSELHPHSLITDQNQYGLLLRPNCIGTEFLSRDDVFDEAWFLTHAKNVVTVDYDGNHKF